MFSAVHLDLGSSKGLLLLFGDVWSARRMSAGLRVLLGVGLAAEDASGVLQDANHAGAGPTPLPPPSRGSVRPRQVTKGKSTRRKECSAARKGAAQCPMREAAHVADGNEGRSV